MMFLIDIVGIVLLIQGFGSLAQRAAGQDTGESFFIVNQIPQFQPYASVFLGILGILLLGGSSALRRKRKGKG